MNQSLPGIYFHYLTPSFYFPQRAFTKVFIASIFANHHKQIDTINYIFCTDQYLLTLNKTHLNHNYYTDIITFDLSHSNKIMADIFISVERAKENAALFKTTKVSELLRLLIHGVLHLCGYKDKTKKDAQEMRILENEYLNAYWFHVKHTKGNNFN